MLAPVVDEVCAALGNYVYGVDVAGLPEQCLKLLRQKNLTFATAESCTGGLIAESFTALSGASNAYRGGVVSYWTSVKQGVLGVDGALLDRYGAVSEPVARAMSVDALFREVFKC